MFSFTCDKIAGEFKQGVLLHLTIHYANANWVAIYWLHPTDENEDVVNVEDEICFAHESDIDEAHSSDIHLPDEDAILNWDKAEILYDELREWIRPMRQRILELYLPH